MVLNIHLFVMYTRRETNVQNNKLSQCSKYRWSWTFVIRSPATTNGHLFLFFDMILVQLCLKDVSYICTSSYIYIYIHIFSVKFENIQQTRSVSPGKKVVDVCPVLWYRPDWWPKRCPILTYVFVLRKLFFCRYEPSVLHVSPPYTYIYIYNIYIYIYI